MKFLGPIGGQWVEGDKIELSSYLLDSKISVSDVNTGREWVVLPVTFARIRGKIGCL